MAAATLLDLGMLGKFAQSPAKRFALFAESARVGDGVDIVVAVTCSFTLYRFHPWAVKTRTIESLIVARLEIENFRPSQAETKYVFASR